MFSRVLGRDRYDSLNEDTLRSLSPSLIDLKRPLGEEAGEGEQSTVQEQEEVELDTVESMTMIIFFILTFISFHVLHPGHVL